MPGERPNLDSLFLAALDFESPEERAAYLTQACGSDKSLLSEVQQLLRSHEQAGGVARDAGQKLRQPLPITG
jgi:hypothetical protein